MCDLIRNKITDKHEKIIAKKRERYAEIPVKAQETEFSKFTAMIQFLSLGVASKDFQHILVLCHFWWHSDRHLTTSHY